MRISDWSSDVCSSDLAAVGARLVKTDGPAKVTGRELYGADKAPAGALWLRVIRAPHARARFTLGDLDDVVAKTPGLARILTAADLPGNSGPGNQDRKSDV